MNENINVQQRDKCNSCGADLKFNPNGQNLKCKHCGGEYPIAFTNVVQKRNFKDTSTDYSSFISWKNESKIIKCRNCGAEVVLDSLEYAKNCPYCESSNIFEMNQLPTLAPDGIIPFAFDEVEAQKKFQQKVKKKFFVPRAFKNQKNDRVIKRQIYAPSFSFDTDTKSTYHGVLIIEHPQTDSNGNTRTKIIRRPIHGNKDLSFRNHLIESSSKISQHDLNGIKPYKIDQAVAFNKNFVKGYNVEHFSNTIQECYAQAKVEMQNIIRRSILSGYSYDRVGYLDVKTSYLNEKFSYILLPLYKLQFSYKKKAYLAYMNGQTGKIGGKLPISALKITLLVLSILFSVVGFVLLILIFGGM